MAERRVIAERDFTPDAASVSSARRFVLSALDVDAELADPIQLAVSELATNAVLHARSPFRIRVARDDDGIRVSVYDESPATAAKKNYGPDAVTGRGLTIVEQLTDEWGVTPDGGGKWVWFELSRASQGVG